MGSSQGAGSAAAMPSMCSAGTMFDGLPAAPVDSDDVQRRALMAAGTKARATSEALDAVERRALRLYMESLGTDGAGQSAASQEQEHGRRAHSSTQQWHMPSYLGSAQARANTLAPQEHDWVCPSCNGFMHGRHRACHDCRVDRCGRAAPADRCPWRCSTCGHINTYKEDVCRGKPGVRCGHLRSIVGAHGAEFTGNDWVCVRCLEHGNQMVRMWVGKKVCRVCYTALVDMYGVTRVKDYPEGTVFV